MILLNGITISPLKRILDIIVVAVLFSLFIVHIFLLGDIVLDSGDGLKHFQIAKYAWKYPHLFLDHWGKPVFTLLSSPFAQFGFQGMLFFNTGLFLITSILLLKIAKLLNLKYRWLAVVFCFIAPVYFMMVLSGLTEILFALAVVGTVFFFLRENFLLGTIILSFSFFIRPESVAVVPWLMLYLLIKRQYFSIPFIFTAFVTYSVIGYFYFNDFFWVINQKPYSNTGTYGSGNLFHFILNYKNITGSIVFIFLSVGSVIILIKWIKDKFSFSSSYLKWILLFIMPIVSVYAVHSVLWWKGMQGSAGLLRVMATVVPLMALVTLFTVNSLVGYGTKKILWVTPKHINLALILLGVVLVIKQNMNVIVETNLVVSQNTLDKAVSWYKKNAKDRKIYYMPPYFAYKASIDPYSEKGSVENMRRFKNKEKPSKNINDGELILWETQFSIKEGKLMLENLMNDNQLELVKQIQPNEKVIFWDEEYKVFVFRKK